MQKLLGEIVPQVLIGLDDASDDIVSATLSALSVLVQFCTGSIVARGVRRVIFPASLSVCRLNSASLAFDLILGFLRSSHYPILSATEDMRRLFA